MTNWLPQFERTGAPIYRQIADAMQKDIDGGILPPGSKLPPQRDLAFDIGVTIGTISRAYALARQRGLVTGEVGRGTFVRQGEGEGAMPAASGLLKDYVSVGEQARGEPRGSDEARIRLDSTSAPEVGQAKIITRHVTGILADYPERSTDYIRSFKPEWQEAGRSWLSTGGWQPDVSTIVPTLGVHAGLMAVIAALTSPGDRIAFEAITYASLARATTLIGRRPIPVPINEDGLDVEAFDHICANQHPKIVVVIPTLQNPTTAIMPAPTRAALAETARRHSVHIIEDNIYGACVEAAPPPIAAIAPEITFHLGGLSKLVAAGIRAGWIACPQGFAGRMPVPHKMLTGGMPFLLAETAARLINSGEATGITRAVRDEVRARRSIVTTALHGYDYRSHEQCPFIWLRLPESWRSSLFATAARNAGLLIDGDDEFQFTQDHTGGHFARIAFTTVPSHHQLRSAVTKLRHLLDAGPCGYDTYS